MPKTKVWTIKQLDVIQLSWQNILPVLKKNGRCKDVLSQEPVIKWLSFVGLVYNVSCFSYLHRLYRLFFCLNRLTLISKTFDYKSKLYDIIKLFLTLKHFDIKETDSSSNN